MDTDGRQSMPEQAYLVRLRDHWWTKNPNSKIFYGHQFLNVNRFMQFLFYISEKLAYISAEFETKISCLHLPKLGLPLLAPKRITL